MKKLSVILCLIALFGITRIEAQSFKIGIGGGLNMAQSEPIPSLNYEKSAGFNFGVKAKLGLPLLPITFTGQIYYYSFNGKYEGVDLERVFDGTPGGSFVERNVKEDLNSHTITMGLGAEYSLIPGPISPYLGADLYYADFDNVNASQSVGLGLGAGVDLKLLPVVDLDISAKYNFFNLIGQDEDDSDFGAMSIMANVMFGF